ncbi:DUF2971 domain-containing protein [Agrobacterium rubi]|uniref:DUF2971 domain-containing protein n=1 Tax=Agrobacterium rubi TaxID=28099 RepID=UPI0015746D60|nr:DUF2971 domain-containing protein [Agrobacterium rubi]NTF06843.1 DUF2971 domain-containing protein [Agrobacterium rubi]NTF19085.1 DUF2971 domain-containing protein [Agrobacterium rubi]NTF26048.1 DUF2971 domain-containing protein [Agrobacterium rubi]
MRLFYFTGLRYALAAIRDERLKISKFSELNDPADHIGIYVEGADRFALQNQRKRFDEQGGIICMSRNWREPLLWGHYGGNYHGACLIFDTDPEWWFDLMYIDKRPTLAAFGAKRYADLTERDLFALGIMKSASWIYEAECRRFVPFDEYDFVENIHFKKFDDAMKLRGILFGFRSNVSDKQLEGIMRTNEELKIGFTRHSEKYFHVILNQTKKTIVPQDRKITYDSKKNLVL